MNTPMHNAYSEMKKLAEDAIAEMYEQSGGDDGLQEPFFSRLTAIEDNLKCHATDLPIRYRMESGNEDVREASNAVFILDCVINDWPPKRRIYKAKGNLWVRISMKTLVMDSIVDVLHGVW